MNKYNTNTMTKIINDKQRADKLTAQLKEISESNKKLDAYVGFKLTNEQLHKLKLKAQSENRTISNYIKNQLL